MAVERLDVSAPPIAGSSVTPSGGAPSRSTDPIGPAQGDSRIEAAFAVGGVAAAGVRRAPADPEVTFDPVEEVGALAGGRAIGGAAGGLAAQMLDYVAPQPRNADALMQPRIVPLLGLAAEQVGTMAGRSDVLDSVGIRALQQELENYRALAEQRSNRIE